MSEIRRYSLAAVVLLVVLRLAIGWQLLYEGLWKIDTLDSPQPWTAAGYLKNSTGPMRDTFRNLAGDPDDLGWLDYDTVSARWQDWSNRFQAHYKLDEKQTGSLNRLLYGSQSKVGDRTGFGEPLAKLPLEGDKLAAFEKRNSAIWFDAANKRIYIDAQKLVQPDELATLKSLVKGRDDADAEAYVTALDKAYDRQKKSLGFLRKLQGAVQGDPELLGSNLKGWEDTQQLGKLDEYKERLAEYHVDYAKAKTESEWDHLSYRWNKIQTLRAGMTGPVKAMEYDFQEQAINLLKLEQHGLGAMPKPWTALRISDIMTIVGLTALGTMLIFGLFTRFAAFAAAFMLFNFYLAMPPLPGLPPAPGPEHSFIVNKNLIEVFALLAIGVLPSGKWFGLDGLLAVFFGKWQADKKLSPNLKATVLSGDEPETAAVTA